MGDNLKVTLSIEEIRKLIATKEIDASQYCVLSPNNNPDKAIIITTDRKLKQLLISNYHAEEISDWAFNEEYQRNKNLTEYKVIGDASLIDKGYILKH